MTLFFTVKLVGLPELALHQALQGHPACAPGFKLLRCQDSLHALVHLFAQNPYILHVFPDILLGKTLGAEVAVPTPEGSVKLKIPPRTQNGTRLRLRGKGVPRRRGGAGDLFVRVRVQLPPADAKIEPEHLEKLAREFEPLYEGLDVRRDLRGGS